MRRSLYGFFVLALVVITGAWACNVSTANLSEVKTGKDKDVTQAASTFKAGDTIYATAAVANNPGKVSVKLYIIVDDAPGMTKGSTITNSDATIPVDGDGTVRYNFPTSAATKGGKFTVVADMLNENGERKDSKSASFTVEAGAASAAPAADDKSGDNDGDKDDK
ncbi:MAG TPA: hypothetical protein VL501_03535 [Pyrinomonadaceae bacterium]|nr:hypothetical protein [Pyrinomonadaceae bacterium]